jgi:hypothetical protein
MGKNIIAPNAPDANRAAETAAAIARWNYEKSVEKVKPLVLRWKGLTIQVARELYLARKFLTSQRGQRRDPRADDYLAYSWSGYCEAINLPRQTANGWLRDFIPAELSETGEDVLLSKEELKALAPRPRRQRGNRSGVSPVLWRPASARRAGRGKKSGFSGNGFQTRKRKR